MNLLALALALSAPPNVAAPEITLNRLLGEMVDLGRLARRPNPPYVTAQSSSYDRAAVNRDTNWFANGDAGKFLRVEDRQGRHEYVMADLKGPGAVMRIWSANPIGTIRFYFDDEATARFAWPMADLLQGKVEPFKDPFSYNASSGTDLYFPIPYAKRLLITADESGGDRVKSLYYHVDYRTYSEAVRINSLSASDLEKSKNEIARVGDLLAGGLAKRTPRRRTKHSVDMQITPGLTSTLFSEFGSGAVVELRVRLTVPNAPKGDLPWDSPYQLHNALRTTRLIADFDGERCVDVPIGDFFGSSPGLNPYMTLPMEMRSDGWMICRFVMPFRSRAEILVGDGGQVPVRIESEASISDFRWGGDAYHFYTQWIGERTFTRPMRDMMFLDALGEGRYVGSTLHIANPVPDWWGEGDEKVYVDGESFPSIFGTGSEDYFGYAWGSPDLFMKPYHAQPRCDGPGTRGHDSVLRWHIADDIPYTHSIRFDIEMWHWAEVTINYDRMAYWYARPGGTRPLPPDSRLLLPVEIPKPPPVAGAIEGEKMPIARLTGGETEIQQFGELSDGNQLWWRDAVYGNKLVLRFNVKEAGEYEVVGNFCLAADYGIHRLSINDVAAKSIDFYSSGLKWEVKSLGKFSLPAGEAILTVECLGHREAAKPRNMFGLDYLLLKKTE